MELNTVTTWKHIALPPIILVGEDRKQNNRNWPTNISEGLFLVKCTNTADKKNCVGDRKMNHFWLYSYCTRGDRENSKM